MHPSDPTGEDATLSPEAGWTPNSAGSEVGLGRGSAVGRYVVLSELGRGGMGAVYEAFDPDLERVVALKLLQRSEVSTAGDLASDGARMLQEARAMAKLRHPNVITVYDVGVLDGSVFVAMELIRGQTLGAWLAEQTRSQAEILDVYREAGAGLAAAHDAGVVHRDFKPDNVLVSNDGRVVVLDFGLAAHAEDGAGSAPAGDVSDGSENAVVLPPGVAPSISGSSLARLTATGSVMGTPAYMAPEQYGGRSTDPRGDQFSFCVALYEALVGKRPFSGDTLMELAAAVCEGRQDELPPEVKLPGWVAAPLQRGLSLRPEERWPDMRALLQQLDRNPRRRRQWLAAGGALVLAIAGVVGFGVFREHERVASCEENGHELNGVWGEAERVVARERFTAVAGEFGTDTFARTDAILNDKREAWLASQAAVCRAQPPDQELRTQCLDLARAGLAMRSRVFQDAERPMVESAVRLASGADDPQSCLDDEHLARRWPTPPAADIRPGVAAAREQIVQASALQQAGQPERAQELAAAALVGAEQTGYAPIIAEATMRVAVLEVASGKLASGEERLWTALALASRNGGHPYLAAEIWVRLLYWVGSEQGRSSEAKRWLPLVEAMVRDLGEEVLVRRFEANAGTLMLAAGDLDAAEEYASRALALTVERYGEGALQTTNNLNNLGVVAGTRGQLDAASRYFEKVLKIRERSLGPTHPRVALALRNLAMSRRDAEPVEALAYAVRALEINTQSLPAVHPEIASGWDTVGALRYGLEDYEGAAAAAERALEIEDELFPAAHPSKETTLTTFALATGQLGRYQEACEAAEKALEYRRRRLGDEHRKTAASLHNLVLVSNWAGKHTRALEAATEWLVLAPKLGRAPKSIATLLAHAAIAHKGLGEDHLAKQFMEQALATPQLEAPDRATVVDELRSAGLRPGK